MTPLVLANYNLTLEHLFRKSPIRFTHNKYSPQTIDIDERHLAQSKGLMRAYKVDVRLDPK